MHRPKDPIGVFDSGIGGLTVLKEITRRLPTEDTIYLGDTARVPYGSKSRETVERYSVEVARFLSGLGIKLLVVACNTASAYAVARLSRTLDIPVIGVIEPGAKAAVASTRTGRTGVIGTEGTIRSGAYTSAIKALAPDSTVTTRACPLFVPLAEEGLLDDEITELAAERYLAPLRDGGGGTEGVDTLVLGCTHYPLLKGVISRVMGPEVTLIDSAEATAVEVERVLGERGLLRGDRGGESSHAFHVTDSPERFARVGAIFFGPGLTGAELTSLD